MDVDGTRLAIALLAVPVSVALLLVAGPIGLLVGYGLIVLVAVPIRTSRETRRRIDELEQRVAELEAEREGGDGAPSSGEP